MLRDVANLRRNRNNPADEMQPSFYGNMNAGANPTAIQGQSPSQLLADKAPLSTELGMPIKISSTFKLADFITYLGVDCINNINFLKKKIENKEAVNQDCHEIGDLVLSYLSEEDMSKSLTLGYTK